MSEELRELLREMAPHLSGLERAALFAAKVLGDAEQRTATVKDAVALARIDYEKAKASTIALAQETGLIDGSNADTRKRQVETILAESSALHRQDAHIRSLEAAVATGNIDVSYYQNVFKVLIEAVRREVHDAVAG